MCRFPSTKLPITSNRSHVDTTIHTIPATPHNPHVSHPVPATKLLWSNTTRPCNLQQHAGRTFPGNATVGIPLCLTDTEPRFPLSQCLITTFERIVRIRDSLHLQTTPTQNVWRHYNHNFSSNSHSTKARSKGTAYTRRDHAYVAMHFHFRWKNLYWLMVHWVVYFEKKYGRRRWILCQYIRTWSP